MTKEKLIVFDTTLRDGEQSPGASMTREEKLRIARQLEKMRVDVIEAGFPAASNGDFEAVKAVAEVIKDSRIAALCRTSDQDIARALAASILSSRPVRCTWKRSCACRPMRFSSQPKMLCVSRAMVLMTSSFPAKTQGAQTSIFSVALLRPSSERARR